MQNNRVRSDPEILAARRSNINRLQIIIHSDDNNIEGNKEKNICPICLDGYDIGSEIRVMNCSHGYHKACIDEWLMMKPTCPTCRAPI